MRDGEQPKIGHRYFVAHVAQISRGNAQANAVNSTDLAWSGLVRDQEVGGSNPLAPTTLIPAMRTRLGKLNGGEVLRCAQDFACGLGPPQDGSSSNPLAPTTFIPGNRDQSP